MSELQEDLMEAQREVAATKEELNNCKESLEKLQELLQVQSQLSDVFNLYSHSIKNKKPQYCCNIYLYVFTFAGKFELMNRYLLLIHILITHHYAFEGAGNDHCPT